MDWTQLVGELGGYGALLPLIGGMFSAIFSAHRQLEMQQAQLNQTGAEIENKSNTEKLKLLDKSQTGKWVVWMIVGVSLLILSAGVWAPMVGYFGEWTAAIIGAFLDKHINAPQVAVTWYWPKSGSFLFWEWQNLREFTVGPESATHTIVILPTFISMALNSVSFFLMNRVRKKVF